jgi:hypothetical protein
MTDPRLVAALAAALHRTGTPPCQPDLSVGGTGEPTRVLWRCSPDAHKPDAAAILANGAVFLPEGLGPVMVGMAKEIAALRAALALGQVSVSEVAWSLGRDHPEFDRLMMAVTRLANAKETP